MQDLPLDLKHRPRKFSEVVGNTSVVKLLLTRSKQGTLHGRSMMFGGSKGCGKTTLARIVAKAIVCADLQEGEPCNDCEPCKSISDDSSLNFDEFDAATQGTVDRVRSLIEDLDYGLDGGKPRVIILDEAHRLSKPSQDALLKSMEDRRLVVILCTTEPRKIVEAIRSRVEEYPITPPPIDVIVNHLASICRSEGIESDFEALKLVAQARACCPRECICDIDTLRTLGAVDVANARSLFKHDRIQLIVDVLSVIDKDPTSGLAILDNLSDEGAVWIRDTMVQAIAAALRQNVGARSTFPVSTGFFPIRGGGWAALARDLGMLDKPSMSDVEACILSTIQTSPATWEVIQPLYATSPHPIIQTPIVDLNPTVPIIQQTQIIPTITPVTTTINVPFIQTLPKAEVKAPTLAVVKPVKEVFIDGVRFSEDEALTSLDDKIERGSSGPPVLQDKIHARVEFDQRNVPIPIKDFTSGLIRRVKGG